MHELISEYTFASFMLLACNRDAISRCSRFLLHAGRRSLVIVGPTGLGKTHLQCAIGNAWHGKPVVRLNAKSFEMNSKHKLDPKFVEESRAIGGPHLLLIDDLQVVAGMEDIERALFETLLELEAHHRHTVFCSINRPAALGFRLPRLREWFGTTSMVVELFRPSLDDRRFFVTEYARRSGRNASADDLEMIASLPSANFFELQGRLNRFHAGLPQPDLDLG